jgi:hypothetical protein
MTALDAITTPIDWLPRGRVEEVARAAEGAFDFQ